MIARKAFLENSILFRGFYLPTQEELFLRLIITVYLPHRFFASYSCLTWEMIPKTSICSHIVCVISS